MASPVGAWAMKSLFTMQRRAYVTSGERTTYWRWLLSLVPAGVIVLALALWAAYHAPLSIPVAPPGARVLLFVATGAIALGMRYVRERFGIRGDASAVLPDPLYALYLAAII